MFNQQNSEVCMLIGWKAIAKFLQVDVRTVHRWESVGVWIPVWKVGHRIYISEEELMTWRKKRKRPLKTNEKNS